MTFGAEVKNEIAKSPISKKCCAVAELYGILLVCSIFSHTHIKIVTENIEIAKRVSILFKKAFNINISYNLVKTKYIFEIENPWEIEKIFLVLGYDHKYHINYNLNRNILDLSCCENSFFKGLFLMTGIISSPLKKTHLEISTTRKILSREIMALMLDLELNPKESIRKNSNVIYFKESTAVTDFLTRLSATNSAMKIMDGKVTKEIINKVNRRVNCETANLSKIINAAGKQIDTINMAIEKKSMDIFPEKLHITISLRINNPELSLNELASLHNPPLSKSALNHKMRKILQICEEILERKE